MDMADGNGGSSGGSNGGGTKKVDVNVNAPAAAGKSVPGKSP